MVSEKNKILVNEVVIKVISFGKLFLIVIVIFWFYSNKKKVVNYWKDV